MEVTKEEFHNWKNSAVTIHVLETLGSLREDYIDALRGYVRAGNSVAAARCEGNIEGIEQLLEIEYSDPAEERI